MSHFIEFHFSKNRRDIEGKINMNLDVHYLKLR